MILNINIGIIEDAFHEAKHRAMADPAVCPKDPGVCPYASCCGDEIETISPTLGRVLDS